MKPGKKKKQCSRAALIIPVLKTKLFPMELCQCFIDLHPFLVRSHDHLEQTTTCAALNPEELYLSNQENESFWFGEMIACLRCTATCLRMTSRSRSCGLCRCNSRPGECCQSGYWSGWDGRRFMLGRCHFNSSLNIRLKFKAALLTPTWGYRGGLCVMCL